MTRDHLLFLIIGALGGFITGYLAHETMAARQPAPLWAGAAGPEAAAAMAARQNPQGNPAAGTQGGAPGAAAGAGPQAAMEGVQKLRQHVADNPEDYDAVRQLANLNYDIANWSRAAELYERYLTEKPGDPDVLTDLGACLRNLGKSQEALDAFQRARASAPDHWQAMFNEVLVVAFDLGDPAGASEALAELEKLQPSNPQVVRLAEEVRRRQGAS